jgi:hypothetical protein
MMFRTPSKSRFRRFITLSAVLILLVYLFLYGQNQTWNVELTVEGQGKQFKEIVDAALDDFISNLLSTVDSERLPEDLNNIFDTQAYLDCLIKGAKWAKGSQLTLVLAENCKLPSRPDVSHRDICQLLSGKKVLFVGPETTYLLHSIWLDSVEAAHNRTHICPGRNFCTFHHICRGFSDDSESDERVGRKKKIPSGNVLRTTKSSLLQYTFSSTLYASSNKSDSAYMFPAIDQETGVQQINQYWIRRALKADVIVLNRPPLPAPVSTYDTVNPSGNWTFASALCIEQNLFSADACGFSLSYGLALAAVDSTLRNFLPSVLRTVKTMSADPIILGRSLRVWQGTWFIQSSCARKGLPERLQLHPKFWEHGNLLESGMDPWTFFYNAQGTILFHSSLRITH